MTALIGWMASPLHLFAQAGVDVDSLEAAINTDDLDGWDYLTAGIILVAAFIVSRVAKVAVRKAIERGGGDAFIGQLLGRLVGYLVVAIGLVYALDTLGIAAGPAIGALGIVGIALAFALQDLLENFVAGVLIQLRRPFTTGQEVVLADTEGTVAEIDARVVVLDTPDGEQVRIPSLQVVKNPIVNHTARGLRRSEIVVGVAYESDLRRCQQVLLDTVAGADGVDNSRDVEALVSEFGDSSINFTVRFWHEPSIRSAWHTRSAVGLAIHRAFEREGIEIPFPQRVVTMQADGAGDEATSGQVA